MLNRRQFASLAAAPLLAQQRRPNLVLIVSDDHQWQCFGAAGNPHIRTPNLDRLAQRGVLFTNGIISTAQCCPSRGVLLSGQEIYQTGLESNGYTSFRRFTGATVVEQLRRGGYETNLVGKWHITPTPNECGFSKAPLWLRGGASPYLNPGLRHGLEASADTETPGHITDLFTTAATRAIREARQPYLLWLTYNAPHTPWTASPQYQEMYQGRYAAIAPPKFKPGPRAAGEGKKKKQADGYDWETYYAVISELDAGIGRVVEAVEKSGQWDNTLIVFVGDNGYLCGAKGLQGKVYPWEDSVRVPFAAAGGLVTRPGKSDAAVASIDIPATLLDVAGIRPGHRLAGTSFRETLTGGRFGRDCGFSCWNDGRPEALAVRRVVEPYRLVRTPTHKYIVWESKKEALFDLTADPFEERNLAGESGAAAVLKRLKERLRARMSETADPAAAWL